MKFKLDRVISVTTLGASLIAIFLVLKKPAPVAQPPAPATVVERTQPSSQKQPPSEPGDEWPSPPPQVQSEQAPTQPAQTSASSETSKPTANLASAAAKPEAHVNSEAVSAALTQALGAAGTAGLTPDSNVGNGSPNIKDQQVTMDGDIVHGRFLTEIGGRDVWVTISGHMGEKDGYATFDPTEFKVGDTEVPVELVNPALQKKLAEERDRLKVPDNNNK